MIRAINQRWLIKFWKRSLGSRKLPEWQSVEAENLSAISANLSFLNVIGSGSSARYQISFHGTTIAQVYGATDCRGKFLDEYIPPTRRLEGLAPYQQAVQRGCPVYTINEVADRNGLVVQYERLLLPFASSGETVDRILASFEFISIDGAFESRELMKSQTVAPVLRLSATIERAAMV